jgi:hypothetical protein
MDSVMAIPYFNNLKIINTISVIRFWLQPTKICETFTLILLLTHCNFCENSGKYFNTKRAMIFLFQ